MPDSPSCADQLIRTLPTYAPAHLTVAIESRELFSVETDIADIRECVSDLEKRFKP